MKDLKNQSQLKKQIIKNEQGFTIVGAIVAIVALIAGIMLVAQLTGTIQLGEKRLDNVVAADQVLALTARMVLEEDFDKTKLSCEQTSNGNSKKPVNEDAKWNCLDGSGKFNNAIGAVQGKLFLNRLNNKADSDANGRFCVELTRCEYLMNDQMMDVNITVFSPDPKSDGPAHLRSMKFRKTRW